MNWQDFFRNHSNCLIYGHEDMVHFTTEELYQAYKSRLLYEQNMKVNAKTPEYRRGYQAGYIAAKKKFKN